jgi:uncharacterized protein YlbG (UPF0298 family)
MEFGIITRNRWKSERLVTLQRNRSGRNLYHFGTANYKVTTRNFCALYTQAQDTISRFVTL